MPVDGGARDVEDDLLDRALACVVELMREKLADLAGGGRSSMTFSIAITTLERRRRTT
jgi:hypothetical protein